MRLLSFCVASALLLPLGVRAQQPFDSLSLAGRSTIALGIGLTGSRSASAEAGIAATRTTGEVASIGFSHWVRPSVAIGISVALLDADTYAAVGHASNNAVTPILFGVSVSPVSLALSRGVRPYVSVAAGPYIHSFTDAVGAQTSATVDTQLGARFAAGMNWFFTRHIMWGFEGAYHAVPAFDRPAGLTTKPGGFGLSTLLGFAWGG